MPVVCSKRRAQTLGYSIICISRGGDLVIANPDGDTKQTQGNGFLEVKHGKVGMIKSAMNFVCCGKYGIQNMQDPTDGPDNDPTRPVQGDAAGGRPGTGSKVPAGAKANAVEGIPVGHNGVSPANPASKISDKVIGNAVEAIPVDDGAANPVSASSDKGTGSKVPAGVTAVNPVYCWDDKETLISTLEWNPESLGCLPPKTAHFNDDRDVVLVAVTRSGCVLKFASDRLKANEEVVGAAVTQDGTALQYASHELKANEEVVRAAVEQNALALEHASSELKGNVGVVLLAVTKDGLALKHASLELKANEAVVFLALEQNPEALEFADQRIRDAHRTGTLSSSSSSPSPHSVNRPEELIQSAEETGKVLSKKLDKELNGVVGELEKAGNEVAGEIEKALAGVGKELDRVSNRVSKDLKEVFKS